MKEINRKRLNVVVSGLTETGTLHGDTQLFLNLCGEFLGLQLAPTKCVRLGKVSPSADGETRPRLLLVSFATELETNSILSVARRLREAANDDVRRYVFINRDMTKEESKAAYERRVARRSATAIDPVVMEASHASSSTAEDTTTRGTTSGIQAGLSGTLGEAPVTMGAGSADPLVQSGAVRSLLNASAPSWGDQCCATTSSSTAEAPLRSSQGQQPPPPAPVVTMKSSSSRSYGGATAPCGGRPTPVC